MTLVFSGMYIVDMTANVYACLYVSGDVCMSSNIYMHVYVWLWTPEVNIRVFLPHVHFLS